MTTHARIPAPPRLARSWVNKMLGLGVGVAVGLAPLLGKTPVPGFKSLLSLYPESLQFWVIPLAAFLMGGMATAVQFYGEERMRRRWLRRMFGRLGVGLLVALVAFVFVYQRAVERLAVGEDMMAFVKGMGARSPECPCGAVSDAQCIKELSLDEARIKGCWGRGAIDTSSQLLALNYLVFMGGLGALVGMLVLQGQEVLRLRHHRRTRGKHRRAPGRSAGKGAHPGNRKPTSGRHTAAHPRHPAASHPPAHSRQK